MSVVVVDREGDGIVEHRHVDSYVHVFCLLPFEVRVWSRLAVDDVLSVSRQYCALLECAYEVNALSNIQLFIISN